MKLQCIKILIKHGDKYNYFSEIQAPTVHVRISSRLCRSSGIFIDLGYHNAKLLVYNTLRNTPMLLYVLDNLNCDIDDDIGSFTVNYHPERDDSFYLMPHDCNYDHVNEELNGIFGDTIATNKTYSVYSGSDCITLYMAKEPKEPESHPCPVYEGSDFD